MGVEIRREDMSGCHLALTCHHSLPGTSICSNCKLYFSKFSKLFVPLAKCNEEGKKKGGHEWTTSASLTCKTSSPRNTDPSCPVLTGKRELAQRIKKRQGRRQRRE